MKLKDIKVTSFVTNEKARIFGGMDGSRDNLVCTGECSHQCETMAQPECGGGPGTGFGCDSDYCQSGYPHICAY